MSLSTPSFWSYDVDTNNEFIVPDTDLYDDRGCKLYTSDAFQLLSTQKKNLTLHKYIHKEYDVIKRQTKIYLMTYIFYLIYNTQFNLNNKRFNNTVISKLYEFIKDNDITYQERRMFNQILYLFTGKYICEFKECTRTCCNNKNTYCNIHIRRINKDSKTLTNLTKLPLDISKLVYYYIV